MRRATWVLLAGVVSVMSPSVAAAATRGAAPVRDARGVVSRAAHASFPLPAGGWSRSASPAGRYTREVAAPYGTECLLTLDVSVRLQRSEPNIGTPLGNGGLLASGQTGSLTWLVGRADGLSIASARQQTPARLRSSAYRWVFDVVRLGALASSAPTSTSDSSCASLRAGTSLQGTISHMALTPGPLPT